MSAIRVKLLFFAKSRELVGGAAQASMEVEPAKAASVSYAELLDLVCQNFPKLNSIRDSLNLALNEAYLDTTGRFELKNDDEIAIIPPISGG